MYKEVHCMEMTEVSQYAFQETRGPMATLLHFVHLVGDPLRGLQLKLSFGLLLRF